MADLQPAPSEPIERRPRCMECFKPLESWAEPHSIQECIEYEAQRAFRQHEEKDGGDA